MSANKDLQNQVLTEKILKQHKEIKNLKRSLSAQVAITESLTAKVKKMKGETSEQIKSNLKNDELELLKSEAKNKIGKHFT